MSPSSLPQEIIEMVIDELRDETLDLVSCLQVSRAFAPRCRKHIFRVITLCPPGYREIIVPDSNYERNEGTKKELSCCQRFSTLLLRSPHVGEIVRELEVVEGSASDGTEKWVTKGRTLALVLQALPKLVRISILALDALYWYDFPRTLKKSLLEVFKLSGLRTIELDGIRGFSSVEELQSLFAHCQSLKNLSLTGLELEDDLRHVPASRATRTAPTTTNQCIQLESLTLYDQGSMYGLIVDILLDPSSPLSGTCLRRLSLCAGEDVAPIFPLLQAAAASLEHLELHLLDELEVMPPLSIVHGLHLRSVRFTFSPPFFLWLSSLVKEMKVDYLEELTIKLSVDSNAQIQWGEWSILDAILTRPVMAPLRRVTVELNWRRNYHEDNLASNKRAANGIRLLLLSCERKGILFVEHLHY